LFENIELQNQRERKRANRLPSEGHSLNVLERCIKFPKEFKQAGISLLSEFANILQTEFGNASASVSILQKGNTVTLRIETLDGDIKQIEKRLDEYGSVLRGELPIEKFTKDKEVIQELKIQFAMVETQLRLTKEFYRERQLDKDKEVSGLRVEVKSLTKLVANAVKSQSSLAAVLRTLASKNCASDDVLLKLTEISELASDNQTKTNKELLKKLLREVEKEDPSFFKKMVNEFATVPAAIAGNLASHGLKRSFPRCQSYKNDDRLHVLGVNCFDCSKSQPIM
jgi:hypothetical protein